MPRPDPDPTHLHLKTSLDHLPEAKRHQLRRITECICQSVPLDRLVLFGSYARGDWVEDPANRYFSDYDLLVVVDEGHFIGRTRLWSRLEQELDRIAGRIPVTLLIHTLKEVNAEIRHGHYFFADIAKEGISLYDSGHTILAPPKAMNPEERLAQGQRNLTYWYNSASGFWRGTGYYMARDERAHAAFLLHQSVERYYHALTLVFTGDKHKTHDIRKLAEIGAELHPALVEAMPRSEAEEKARFDLLRRAYIEARYSKGYRITHEELETLREQVRDLARRVLTAAAEELARHCGAEAVGTLPTPPDSSRNVELPPAPELEDREAVERWSRAILDEGREIGRVEGWEDGRLKGREEGKEEGLNEGAIRIARNLLAEGMDEEQVARVTGLLATDVAMISPGH